MILANPIALLWGLLAVPVVLLYMRRLRARRETVATGAIWQQVLAEENRRSAWQPFRHRVSLAVQLTGLGLLVLAAADPQATPRRTVIIVDNSAAMNLSQGETTRLEEAKQAAKRLIADIGPHDKVGVVSAAKAVAVQCNLTGEKTNIESSIDEISPAGGEANVADAIELARRMLGEDTPGRIVVLSSCIFPGAAELDKAEDIELFRVGKSTANAAITRMTARREPTSGMPCHVLVEVTNFFDKQIERRVLLLLDGKSLQGISLGIPAGGRTQHVFELGTVKSGTLTARIGPGDAYTADDEASLSLPVMRHAPKVTVMIDTSASMAALDAEAGNRGERAKAFLDGLDMDKLKTGKTKLPDGSSVDYIQLTDAAVHGRDSKQTEETKDETKVTAEEAPGLATLDELAGEEYKPDAASANDVIDGIRSKLGVIQVVDCGAMRPPPVIGQTTAASNRPLATAAHDFRVPEIEEEASSIEARRRGADPWLYLAVLAIMLLTAEWCLYQRRWLS